MIKDKSVQKTILVVDDDEIFRETLCSGLEPKYNVLPAANAKEAMAILNRAKIDLILTDVRMPGMSGYELIEWINSHVSRSIPYIVMTGYLNLVEKDQESSAFTFKTVTKPFKFTDLKRVIEESLEKSEEADRELVSESRFCKIPISDILIKPVLEFDIYLQLSEQNFVKVAYKDEELPLAQIKKFKQKGADFLYIRKEDFHKFVQFAVDLTRKVKNSPAISPSQKIALIGWTNKIMMEQVFRDGLDSETYDAVASFMELSISTVTESNEILHLLEILRDVGDRLYTDCLATGLYSVMIARELNYESALTAFKLCIAGVFQDIGKKEIDKELIEKDTYSLSKKEQALLESHVVRSQTILESIKCIHSDIIRIIQEHHEDLEGKGYPFGKKRSEQHPLSRILQCSNVFIDEVNKAKLNNEKVDVASVLQDIEKKMKTKVDADCIEALRKLFKVPPVSAEL